MTAAGVYPRIVRTVAALVLLLAAAVLIGWGIDSDVLKGVIPGLTPMAPLTAVGFILSGAALWLLHGSPSRGPAATLGRVFAFGAAAIGLLTLLEYVTGTDLWIDRLLFEDELRAIAARPVGRIAPNTALSFALAGFALLWLGGRRPRAAWLAQAPALVVALVAVQAFIGYSLGVESLYGIAQYTPIALNTSAAFLALALGILFARPERGPMAVITRPDVGGFTARRLLPGAIVVLFLLGWLVDVGEDAGIYDPPYESGLFAVMSIVVIGLLIWRMSAVLSRIDAERRRADAARAEEATRLRIALATGGMALWTWDLSTNRVVWSPELESMHALPATGRTDGFKTIASTIHPDDADRVRAVLADTLERGEGHVEYRVVHPENGVRWIEAWGSVQREAAGRPARMIGVCRDVTDRVEAQAARSRIAAIVEGSDDAIIGKDLDAVITDWNRGAERLYGYTADEAVGRNISMLVPPEIDNDVPRILEQIRRGERIEHYDTVRMAKDGSRFEVSLTISPIYDRDGRIIGASKIARDVTEQRRAQREREHLLERERQARAEATSRAREEAALREATRAVTATFSTEEVLRRISETALQATEADGAFVQRVDDAARSTEVVAVAGEHVPPLGERTPYEGSATERVLRRGEPQAAPAAGADSRPTPNQLDRHCPDCPICIVPLQNAGEPIGSLVLLRGPDHPPFDEDEIGRADTFADLAALAFRKIHLLEDSERKRGELQEAVESRARLVRGFSHDVKNPLGAAVGQLALLEEGVLGELSQRQGQGVSRARKSIQSGMRIIDTLVDLARVEAGRIEIQAEATDVRGVAREIAEEYRAAADAEELTLETDFAESLTIIQSDPDRVRQILGNLQSNAVKYTPAGGRVIVRVEERTGGRAPGPGRWIAVDIRDTGPGIPEEEREEIFGEFTRLEPGRGRGSGLGLAISRRIARLLGGDVTLESTVGEGSTFTLWLPVDRGDG